MHTQAVFLLLSLLQTTSIPADELLNERFDKAARAIVYARPCNIYGYPVDWDRLREDAMRVQQDARAAGMSEQDAGDKLRVAIELKAKRLSDESAAAHFMTKDEQAARYKRHWKRRCVEVAPVATESKQR